MPAGLKTHVKLIQKHHVLCWKRFVFGILYFSEFFENLVSQNNLWPAVNRQPGYRWGDS